MLKLIYLELYIADREAVLLILAKLVQLCSTTTGKLLLDSPSRRIGPACRVGYSRHRTELCLVGNNGASGLSLLKADTLRYEK